MKNLENVVFREVFINGKLLLTKELTEGDEQIEVLKAVKIVISGDGKEVKVIPDFDTMTSKMKP